MRRFIALLLPIAAALAFAATASAGSPHFISNATSFTTSGNTITVTGKEAGLGDESQVHIVLTATAECVNPGGNHPQAANKTSVTAAGDFPVQNGKADFTLSTTAVFNPNPPGACGEVRFTDVKVVDTTNNLVLTL